MYHVKDYGATGNGIVKDTQAIQNAIDDCHVNGGGVVVVSSGTYLCGTIYIKSNIELHLESGATILGSPDRKDYNADDIFSENVAFASENVTAAHLIIAYQQDNVSITGNGIIDGNSNCFFEQDEYTVQNSSYRFKIKNLPIKSWRPGQMVFFCRCTNVNVSNVKLYNSTYWTLFVLGCRDVHINGLTIENPPTTQNGDGIDIDCSQNVTVSDCIVRSGDDSLTVRANRRALGENTISCENITVSNCILSSPCCAIRVGVGDGNVRNCTFSNIIITNSRTGINMVCRYSKNSMHGVNMENVKFSSFIMDVIIPFSINSGELAIPPAGMKNISFRNFSIKATAGSQIVGNDLVPICDITMSDFDWEISGGTLNCEFVNRMPTSFVIPGYHGMNNQPALPCVLYGRNLHHISFNRVRVKWNKQSVVWHEGFIFDKCKDMELINMRLRQPKDNDGNAILCRSSSSIFLRGCRAEVGTNVFAKIEGVNEKTNVRSTENDFSDATTGLDIVQEVY